MTFCFCFQTEDIITVLEKSFQDMHQTTNEAVQRAGDDFYEELDKARRLEANMIAIQHRVRTLFENLQSFLPCPKMEMSWTWYFLSFVFFLVGNVEYSCFVCAQSFNQINRHVRSRGKKTGRKGIDWNGCMTIVQRIVPNALSQLGGVACELGSGASVVFLRIALT